MALFNPSFTAKALRDKLTCLESTRHLLLSACEELQCLHVVREAGWEVQSWEPPRDIPGLAGHLASCCGS